ncbi:glycerophosphodiester phosphodiesterase family protein [Myxococcus sp. CA040A]|uniref:glycerophosphodiester phosphodiesterase family protein n=1 Tax=Myxococcus sp. CA040A TaxID=2741738 RepID=UPI00157B254D|nr:glycerophosphodiester phosphodiesterase family protein [Myxococcus sp. CA040A]NTX01718.1 glycerophosphodiester phosphodiesterase [Myxococcus sp. CA040A]
MYPRRLVTLLAATLAACITIPGAAPAGDDALALRAAEESRSEHAPPRRLNVQVGARPYYLVEDMDESPLKRRLQQCSEWPFSRTEFSIGHRGAPLQFPEHTKESYEAAARMGAGILECDVTFTKDRQLVCRHSQCDLHTTTNILAIPALAAKCTQPFQPADPTTGKPASALCCTSDITLDEFKQLCGKMDAANPSAATVAQYLGGTAPWRTDLYSACGTVLSHRESIELFKRLGTKFTPELKAPSVPMPYQGTYTQAAYAQQMLDEYKQARVHPSQVWPQSFNLDDVKYWIQREPQFGRQAVYLDGRYEIPGTRFDPNDPSTWVPGMDELAASGVEVIAPPIYVLLTLDAQGRIIPSAYARAARAAGLDIIAWSLERDGPLAKGGGFYFQSVKQAINNDGDMLVAVDVLARHVGVIGIFSDWPGTVTYYANCMGL